MPSVVIPAKKSLNTKESVKQTTMRVSQQATLETAWIRVLQTNECKNEHAVLQAPQRKSTFHKFNQLNICDVSLNDILSIFQNNILEILFHMGFFYFLFFCSN